MDHVVISPGDHKFLNVGESMKFERIPTMGLIKVQDKRSVLDIGPGITITGILESYDFIV